MSASSSELLVLELHGRLLRSLAVEAGQHFQGLAQAARFLKRSGRISPVTTNKLLKLDAAYNLVRHITAISVARCESDLAAELRNTSPKTARDSDDYEGTFSDRPNAEESAGDVKVAFDSFCDEFSDHVPGDVFNTDGEENVTSAVDLQSDGTSSHAKPAQTLSELEHCIGLGSKDSSVADVLKMLVNKMDQNEVITSDQLRTFCALLSDRLEKLDDHYASMVDAAMRHLDTMGEKMQRLANIADYYQSKSG